MLVAGRVAGLIRFRDVPRQESAPFIDHLSSRHTFDRIVLVSGDRESEVRYLAETLGITIVHTQKSPEEKVAIVDDETRRQPTLFVGDGLNDAPAMLHATVGVALGTRHEVTSSAAGAVILDGTLAKVDELMHIARRTRLIALQTAIGGMTLSLVGMGLAVAGWLVPLTGAVLQEVIDVVAVVNALRTARPPRILTDYQDRPEVRTATIATATP
jgi:P-type E1-E2 ATPase